MDRLLQQLLGPMGALPAIVTATHIALVLIGAYLTLKVLDSALGRLRVLVPSSELLGSGRGEKRAETIRHILRSVGRVVIISVVVITVTAELGFNLAPLLAGVGIVSLAFGFGAQSLVKDIIAGFFIIFEDQFAVGDVVRVGNLSGTVERMTLRSTVLRNLEGEVHVLPNGNIQMVTVLTKDWAGAQVDVLVPYAEDVDRALKVMSAVGQKLHDDMPDRVLQRPDVLGVERLGDEFVTLRIVARTIPAARWEVRRELRRRLKIGMDEAGIQMPEVRRGVVVAGNGGMQDVDAGPSGPASLK